MGRVNRIVKRNRARAIDRSKALFERVRMDAFVRGFLLGRQYEKRFGGEKGEETPVDSGNADSSGAQGGG
jgi:hypothetical protein